MIENNEFFPITNEILTKILSEPDDEFRGFTEHFAPNCWARYDLSAVHVGWVYGKLWAKMVADTPQFRFVFKENEAITYGEWCPAHCAFEMHDRMHFFAEQLPHAEVWIERMHFVDGRLVVEREG